MGDLPLTLDLLQRRAAKLFPRKTVVSAGPGGDTRVTYGEWDGRAKREWHRLHCRDGVGLA